MYEHREPFVDVPGREQLPAVLSAVRATGDHGANLSLDGAQRIVRFFRGKTQTLLLRACNLPSTPQISPTPPSNGGATASPISSSRRDSITREITLKFSSLGVGMAGREGGEDTSFFIGAVIA